MLKLESDQLSKSVVRIRGLYGGEEVVVVLLSAGRTSLEVDVQRIDESATGPVEVIVQ